MKPFLILKILFLLFLAGCDNCGTWESLPVHVQATTENEINAVLELNAIFHRELFVIADDGISFVKVPFRSMGRGNGKWTVGKSHIECGVDNAIDTARIELDEAVFASKPGLRVVEHELFHSLGFTWHTDRGLMMVKHPLGQDMPLKSLITKDMTDWLSATYGDSWPIPDEIDKNIASHENIN